MIKLKFLLKFFIFYLLFFIFSSPAFGSESLHFVHQDHLGSSTIVTDSTGKLFSRQVYYPYGTTRSVSGNLPTERQYTGQVSDTDETGLYYYNARYYNPQIGKFTQADTAEDGMNRYAYVRNNPLALVDPSGHQSAFPGKDELPPDASKDISNSWQNTLSALNKRNEVMMQPSYYIPALALGGTTLVGLGALAVPVISATVLSSPAALGVLAAFNIISDTITQAACLGGNNASCGEIIAAAQMDPTGLAGPAALLDEVTDNVEGVYGLTRSMLAARGKKLTTLSPDQVLTDPVTGFTGTIGGYANADEIVVQLTGDRSWNTYILGHEYNHLVDKNMGITDSLQLEIRTRFAELFGDYPLRMRSQISDEIDWFGRQLSKGVSKGRIIGTYNMNPSTAFQKELKPYLRERIIKWLPR